MAKGLRMTDMGEKAASVIHYLRMVERSQPVLTIQTIVTSQGTSLAECFSIRSGAALFGYIRIRFVCLP